MSIINGKTIHDIFAELAVEKPCEKYLDGKYPYHEIYEYKERMDQVIGKEHYSMHYDECKMIELPNSQRAYVVKCTITVFDDDGQQVPILSAEGYGSSELKVNEKGRYLHLNNVPCYARTAAFKDACRRYDIFGETDVEKAAHSQVGKTGIQKTGNPYDDHVKVAVMETFVTEGCINIVRTDSQSGKPVYELKCYRKCGSQMEDHASSVIFYPNLYKKEERKVNEFVDLVSDGKQHIVTFKTSPSRQAGCLVFKGFK